MNLRLDWCSHKAAKYAVMNWHYSKKMPVGKLVKIGVWENEKFIGVILFGDGILGSGKTFMGYDKMKVAEIVRVALTNHDATVSKLLSISIRMLKMKCPDLILLVSFADTNQNHIGTIYQASNWIYNGLSSATKTYKNNKTGRIYHSKDVNKKGWTVKFGKPTKGQRYSDVTEITSSRKHRYLYPLNKETRKQIEPLAKPYPKKKCDVGVKRSTTSFQDVGGGAIPITSLHLERQYAY